MAKNILKSIFTAGSNKETMCDFEDFLDYESGSDSVDPEPVEIDYEGDGSRERVAVGRDDSWEDERVARLYDACNEGDIAEVERLLEEGGVDVDQLVSGCSAISTAAHENHLEVVELLADRGADVNRCNLDGTDALMLAAFRGHHLVCLALIGRGCDPRVTTVMPGNPIQFSAIHSYGRQMSPPINLNVRNLFVSELNTAFAQGPHPSQVQRRLDEEAQSLHQHMAHMAVHSRGMAGGASEPK